MAQMNRNVNLEEIDSDALFGIDALKNQTILQKIVFLFVLKVKKTKRKVACVAKFAQPTVQMKVLSMQKATILML